MFETRKSQTQCPCCMEEHHRDVKLYEFVDDNKMIGFICKDGCVSIFDISYVTDMQRGIKLVIARKRDPNYKKYQDGDWLDNLIANEEEGNKLHSKSYVIGKIKL